MHSMTEVSDLVSHTEVVVFCQLCWDANGLLQEHNEDEDELSLDEGLSDFGCRFLEKERLKL